MGAPAELLAAGLRALASAVEEGVPLEPDVARRLERIVAPWAAREARERRDRLIRDLAATFTAAGTVNAKALRASAEIRHYRSVCWHGDRRRREPYPRTARRVLLYELFTLDPDPPASPRWINNILSARACSD